MKKTLGICAACLPVLALLIVTTRSSQSQVSGSVPSYVKLQSSTPGVVQNGHLNVNGTAIASQFRGGGSGLTGIDAANIASGLLPDARLSSNVAREDQANNFTSGPNIFSTGFVGIHRSTTVTPAESFGVGDNSATFDGMYVRTSTTGKPFYGYSLGGAVSAYTYMDGATNEWKLRVSGSDVVIVDTDGHIGMGTDTSISSILEVNGGSVTPLAVRAVSYGSGVNSRYGGYFRGGATAGPSSYGVYAEADGTGVNRSILAYVNGGTNHAIYAVGNLSATGTKSFEIDHPLDPANKVLRHYCAEGDEPRNIYQGHVTTDSNGYAWIDLPEYYQSINRDPEYNLSIIDSSADFVLVKVTQEVVGNKFQIRTSKPRVKVSWEVKAVRNDLWVQKYGFPVEVPKNAFEQGKYLRPELYGKPREKGVFCDPQVQSSKDLGQEARSPD